MCATLYAQAPDLNAPQPGSQYEGPSILSRDKTLIGERGGKLIDFTIYGTVTGVYDSGLTPVSIDKNGNLVNPGGNEGVEAGFGLIGSKQWKRDSLSLEYRGSYRHYVSNSYYDGTDQFLNLRYGRILARHLTLDFSMNAGTTNLGNGGFSYLPLTTTDQFAIPTNDLFDNRTYFLQSRVNAIWQKTARLSFAFGGQGYVVRRQAASLAGLNGYAATGDVTYRITRRQSINGTYTYTHFDFQKLFGYSTFHQATLGYNVSLAKKLDLGVNAGGSFVEVRGLQTTQVDPAIVAIVGQATVVTSFHNYVAVPAAEVRLTKRFTQSSISANASTGVSPGNGVYLTSRQTSVGMSYDLLGRKRWTAGARFQYSNLTGFNQTLGKYNGYSGGIGATYLWTHSLHVEFRYDYRHFDTQGGIYTKDSNRFSLGLAFSPGEKPLPIW